ncbi:MAG: ABC transporter ATP-binding protein, partial [Fusobacteriaceae bacterium]
MRKKIKLFKNESINSFIKYSFEHKLAMFGVIILSSLASAAAASPAWFAKSLMDEGFIKKNKQMVILIVIGYFISVIIKVISTYYSTITSSYVTETVKREIRQDVFKHLQNLPLSYYKKNKLGDIMARLSNDSGSLGQIAFTLFEIFKESLLAIILAARLFYVDWQLTLASLIVAPFMAMTIRKYSKKIKDAGRIRQDTSGQVSAFMQESLSGIQVIKAFNKADKMVRKYIEISLDEFKKSFKSRKITALVSPLTEISTTSMVVLVVVYAAYKISIGKMTFGDLVSFITAVGLMQQPVRRLIDRNSNLHEQLPSADRVIEIMDEPIEREYFGEAPEKIFDRVEKIKFENVCFSYTDDDRFVLQNINLEVNSGEVIAFVGKSGSGKTSLANLIPRFYEVTSGAIKINEIDIKNYSLTEYRNFLGIVPQETFLFSGTIADNICFA